MCERRVWAAPKPRVLQPRREAGPSSLRPLGPPPALGPRCQKWTCASREGLARSLSRRAGGGPDCARGKSARGSRPELSRIPRAARSGLCVRGARGGRSGGGPAITPTPERPLPGTPAPFANPLTSSPSRWIEKGRSVGPCGAGPWRSLFHPASPPRSGPPGGFVWTRDSFLAAGAGPARTTARRGPRMRSGSRANLLLPTPAHATLCGNHLLLRGRARSAAAGSAAVLAPGSERPRCSQWPWLWSPHPPATCLGLSFSASH